MTQDGVLKLLSKQNKWLTAAEIATKLKQGKTSTNHNIKKLVEQGEIIKAINPKAPFRQYIYAVANLPTEKQKQAITKALRKSEGLLYGGVVER